MARKLRQLLKQLEQRGQLQRVLALVNADLEIAEIVNRMLRQGSLVLMVENVKGSAYPLP